MARTFVGRCRKAGMKPEELGDQIARHTASARVEGEFPSLGPRTLLEVSHHLLSVGEEDFDGLLERRLAEWLKVKRCLIENPAGVTFRGFVSSWLMSFRTSRHSSSASFRRLADATQACTCSASETTGRPSNAFAGSDLQYFNCAEQHFPPAIRLPIATNYRSAACVVEVGNRLMAGLGIVARPAKDQPGRVLVGRYRML